MITNTYVWLNNCDSELCLDFSQVKQIAQQHAATIVKFDPRARTGRIEFVLNHPADGIHIEEDIAKWRHIFNVKHSQTLMPEHFDNDGHLLSLAALFGYDNEQKLDFCKGFSDSFSGLCWNATAQLKIYTSPYNVGMHLGRRYNELVLRKVIKAS